MTNALLSQEEIQALIKQLNQVDNDIDSFAEGEKAKEDRKSTRLNSSH